MTNGASGRQRAFRIRLDHYKSADWILRSKLLLSAVALVLAGGWSLWGLTGGRQSKQIFSHGELAAVHATWDSQCSACHRPGQPLRPTAIRLTGTSSPSSAPRCQNCHEGPKHFGTQQEADNDCATCHQDHRGRTADLTRVADRACVRCHKNIAAAGATRTMENVTSFAEHHHPPFHSLPTDRTAGDPGNIGFTHSRHMRLGLAYDNDRQPMTYGDIDPEMVEQYRSDGQAMTKLVKLQCESCHQLGPDNKEIQRTDQEAWSSRSTGSYMQPISYEQHCQACHPLRIEPDRPDVKLPHGMAAEAIDEYLRRMFRSRFVEENPELFSQQLPHRSAKEPVHPIPGRSEVMDSQSETAGDQIESQLDKARRNLRSQCYQCHDPSGAESEALSVLPANLPVVWLENAEFSHAPHRAVRCTECHSAADDDRQPADEPKKRESKRVMIPGHETCMKCHAPATSTGGGARHDCTECHRYHASDGAFHNDGSKVRNGREKFVIRDFLQGVSRQSEQGDGSDAANQ